MLGGLVWVLWGGIMPAFAKYMTNTKPQPRVLIGITGGIAAYKIASLVRLLTKANFCVQVMMTEAACQFITPLTMQALSGSSVHTALLDTDAERAMGHIALAKWADIVLIAPATANTIAKLANGMGDNLLTCVCLATAAPIVVAPAMNQQMWQSGIVQDNIAKLARVGYHIIPPDSGEQACGDVGAGRLCEPPVLFLALKHYLALSTNRPLQGKKVVVNAGATLEAIDPVRFLSNHSSGKMGYALAQACANAGASVILIAGQTVDLPTPFAVEKRTVGSAAQMLEACLLACQGADVFIAAAAVADFRPSDPKGQKIKKGDEEAMVLSLTKNPDVLATVAATYPTLVTLGFAAETCDVERHAKLKLNNKKLTMIACNDVSCQDIGFGSDDNAMCVFFADELQKKPRTLAKANKAIVATHLVAYLGEVLDDLAHKRQK